MKKLFLTFAALSFLTISPAWAAGNIIHVGVNGLVCDFCARALDKTFAKQDAVDHINVDLDTKVVTVTFKEGQSLDDETITKIITDSGYAVESIHHVE